MILAHIAHSYMATMYINDPMRLDAYLVEQGYVSSRGRAKRAIMEGWVRVDGRVIRKPSYDVDYENRVEVEAGADRPAGYWKLRRIQEESGLIRPGDRVLDVGSSAGGFLMYAAEIAAHVGGIEYSGEFRARLRRLARELPNVSVIMGDVFTMPLKEISAEGVDVILNDLTLDPPDSLSALERIIPLLRSGGRVLQVVKDANPKSIEFARGRMQEMGLIIREIIPSEKREAYIIAELSG